MTFGWYSAAHSGWHLNEIRLIAFCLDHFGDPYSGLETFSGDHSPALTYARELTKSTGAGTVWKYAVPGLIDPISCIKS